jgi:tetratricopeptide (TPR) repeat protein
MHTILLRALINADDKIAPMALFDLVLRHAKGLPDAVATRIWQRLSPWAKRRGCESPSIFGSPTPGAEECATALVQEMAGDLDHAETHWSDAAEHFAASRNEDARLRAALVLRHIALSVIHLSRDDILDQAGAELLTESLQFDVYDRDVHVRLIQFWRSHGDMKKARARLDFGLVYFPDDVAMLTEAVETALVSGAFKKAATAARRLLELDPLNSNVRSQIGKAHLAHAAKQIAAGKPDAARKEIDEAATWLNNAVERGRMQALRAWTEAAGTAERLRLLHEAATHWGGGIAAGWRLLRETQGIFYRANTTVMLGEAGIDPATSLTIADLIELTQALEQDPIVARKGLDPLGPWRKAIAAKAAEVARDQAVTIRICEAFSRHLEHDLVEIFAEAARKHWPDRPIFAYHAIAARFGKRGSIATDRDFDDLEVSYRRAGEDNDLRLKMRIDALFDADQPPPEIDGLDMPFNPAKIDERSVRAMMEMLIKVDGEKAFLAQARQNLGSELFKRIEKESVGNRKAFLKRLVDHVVESLVIPASMPPLVPTKIVKRNAPAAGQGSLFDD